MEHKIYLKKIGQAGGLKNTPKQLEARKQSVIKMNASKAKKFAYKKNVNNDKDNYASE